MFLNFSNRASRKFYPPHMADNMYSREYISKGWCCSRISSVQVLAKCSATLILGGQPSFSPHEALQALWPVRGNEWCGPGGVRRSGRQSPGAVHGDRVPGGLAPHPGLGGSYWVAWRERESVSFSFTETVKALLWLTSPHLAASQCWAHNRHLVNVGKKLKVKKQFPSCNRFSFPGSLTYSRGISWRLKLLRIGFL